MSQTLEKTAEALSARFAGKLLSVRSHCGELTFEVEPSSLLEVCLALRDEPDWRFEQLIDVTGVDYLTFGQSDWNTDSATSSGFSRGRTHLAMARGAIVPNASRTAVAWPARCRNVDVPVVAGRSTHRPIASKRLPRARAIPRDASGFRKFPLLRNPGAWRRTRSRPFDLAQCL